MTTMKEIAQLAGVSRGTVDRVLNHRGSVNPQTEEKILEIAKLLNYQPNKAGIALAAQKKKLKIGVILFGGEENPFFDEIIDGLTTKQEELSIYGCTLSLRRISFDLELQLSAIDSLLSEGIQGLIFAPYNSPVIHRKIDDLWDQGIPCVTVNTDLPDSKRIAYVGCNDYQCGQTAAGLMGLLTKGAGNIAIITGSHNLFAHERRIQGFSDLLATRYPSLHIKAIAENKDDDYKSYEAVSTLLNTVPSISAIFFTAGGVYGGCNGIINSRPSHSLSVISFDSIPTTREMVQKEVISATICQHPDLQGSKSLAILVDYLVSNTLPLQENNYMELDIKIKENL